MNQQVHTMKLVDTRQDGTDEWLCPVCGRHFLMLTTQEYKKVVLEIGDETAIHNGSKGGLSMQAPEINPEPPVSEPEDERLTPFLEWMKQVDFNSLWDQAIE